MQSDLSVSTYAIVLLAAELAFSVILPVVLLIVWAVKTRAKLLPAFAGVMTQVVLSVLEQAIHSFCIGSETPLAAFLLSSPYTYAIYGGLVTGILGAGGQFLVFRLILKSRTERETAITFGLGYGGMECITVLGISMLTNLIIALTLNSMGAEAFVAEYAPTEQAALAEAVGSLNGIGIAAALLPCLERVAMLTLQLELSVFVFTSVRLNRFIFLAIAFEFRLLAGFFFGLNQAGGLPALALELILAAGAALLVYPALRVYRSLPETEEVQLDRFGREIP